MKKILVPTDFSENAASALEFAIPIANHFQAEISLLHVYPRGISKKIDDYARKSSEKQLDGLSKRCRHKMKGASTVTCAALIGDPASVIVSKAGSGLYDLIVMGTQGESGIKGFLVGSVTLEVMRHAGTALLAVPGGCEFRPLKNIVLAMDDHGISKAPVLAPLRHLACIFNSKIQVYHLTNTLPAGVPDLLIDAALDGLDHSFLEEAPAGNVWDCIHDYADYYNADLLCLIHRERVFFENLFHHSVTREELSSSQIPLLILHDEK